jgi:autotransporter-associated beta strand protein
MNAKPVIFLSLTFAFTLDLNAGSATWNLNPTNGDWNTAANWTPPTVPNGSADTATFDLSNITDVTVSTSTTVDGIVFNPGASAFTITPSPLHLLTFVGTGIINSSGLLQNIVSPSTYPLGSISFHNQATAGSNTFFSNLSDIGGQGNVNFFDNSNAGTATFTNYGNEGGGGGSTFFFDHSSAAQGTFINNGAADGATGAHTLFFTGSTAADGTIISNGGVFPSIGGGYTELFGGSNAGNATIIANGGTGAGTQGGLTLFFGGDPANATLIALGGTDGGEGGTIGIFLAFSSASTARVELFGNGLMYLPPQDSHRIELGSIEGEGNISLHSNDLIVGNNNLSTIFSGVISDAGSFTKVGEGILTLRGANTYSGGTTIDGGALRIQNTVGSGTGTGAVDVLSGSLAGSGVVTGAVTVGTGSGAGAFLTPGIGASKATTLTIESVLTFKADGTYTGRLNTKKTKADQLIANGVTIESGAQFAFKVTGDQQLRSGKSATVISNTAATPISGTFANLPDGSTFTIGPNTFQVSYEGGDGNDLILTVVP